MISAHLAACIVSGRQADADGVCPQHGVPACVVSVEVSSPPAEPWAPLQFRRVDS